MAANLEDRTQAELDKPLLSKEYLALRTIEAKVRSATVVKVAIIFSLCQVVVAISVLALAWYTSENTKKEIADQKQIAYLSSVRADALVKNEIKVCEALRNVIVHQQDIAVILRRHISSFHVPGQEFKQQSDIVSGIVYAIGSGNLPACDGFPQGPIANPPGQGSK